ncbi:MAG: AraC family transcriptional regulator [Paenibacillaceae bacterium]
MLARFRSKLNKVAVWSGKQRSGNRGSFYRKSLIWLLLTASIPGFITGGCLYWFAVDRIEEDLNDLHKSQIEQRVKNIDDQFMYLELDLSHWAFSPRFGWDLQVLDFVYYFRETWDISQSLVVLQGSHPLIQNVELFVDGNQPVLFKTGYYKLEDPLLISSYRELLKDTRSMYWTDRETGPIDEGGLSDLNPQESVKLAHKIPGDSPSPFGVLVITLNREKVVNLLKTMTPYNEGTTFLMRESGEVVVSDESKYNDISGLQSVVMKQGTSSGNFLWDWEERTYSVSYGKLKRIDKEWTYVSAAPMTAITAPVVKLSNIILMVSTIGLLLALALSWLASIRMYTPVERLIDESLDLQARLDNQLPSLRMGFLLQLLQGHLHHYTEEDLRERMKRYGWEVDHHQFHVLQIQLIGYSDLTSRFPPGNESLVTFAASNIIEELTKEHFEQFGVINFHDLSVGVLIMSKKNETLSNQLDSLGGEMTKVINRILNIQVTITISRLTDSVKRISETFMEVERASGFRKFVNQNQLLNMDDAAVHAASNEERYPFVIEMDVIQALRNGKQLEAEGLIGRFLEEVLSHHGTEVHVQMSMLQLLGSIQHMILQSGVSTFRLYQGANMFDRLSQIREPGKMLSWMKERIIIPFLLERDARASMQLKQMVERTIEYIQANYMKNISLENCADLVGTNSYTLSKLFKHIVGVNFIDYITELRLDKAKELLRESDFKINDIAEEVGYQQRYFNRIFKKQVGVTPSQYRELL